MNPDFITVKAILPPKSPKARTLIPILVAKRDLLDILCSSTELTYFSPSSGNIGSILNIPMKKESIHTHNKNVKTGAGHGM